MHKLKRLSDNPLSFMHKPFRLIVEAKSSMHEAASFIVKEKSSVRAPFGLNDEPKRLMHEASRLIVKQNRLTREAPRLIVERNSLERLACGSQGALDVYGAVGGIAAMRHRSAPAGRRRCGHRLCCRAARVRGPVGIDRVCLPQACAGGRCSPPKVQPEWKCETRSCASEFPGCASWPVCR